MARRNPLPSWRAQGESDFISLVARVSSCSAAKARKLAEAYEGGCGIEYASVDDFVTLGLSEVQAQRLHGAFVLCRWVATSVTCRLGEPLRGPTSVCSFLEAHLGHLDQEYFVALFLDAQSRVIGVREVAVGSLIQVDVHPREVFRDAVRLRARAVIVAHNHPSGDATPSDKDVEMAHRLEQAGTLVGIPVLDSLIVSRTSTGTNCVSLASLRLMASSV